MIDTPLLRFIHTTIHYICHHRTSMGSNWSVIALSVSGSLFLSLPSAPLCHLRQTECASKLLSAGWHCWQLPSPEPSQLHCSVTLPLPFFPLCHPLIITKPYLLYEGDRVIKATATPDATPAPCLWEKLTFKSEPAATSKSPGLPFFQRHKCTINTEANETRSQLTAGE